MEELREIEEKLRQEVLATRMEYLTASEHSKQAIGINQDLSYYHPDGRSSLSYSVNRQSAAFRAYSKSLHAFNDFILHGKLPESSEENTGK